MKAFIITNHKNLVEDKKRLRDKEAQLRADKRQFRGGKQEEKQTSFPWTESEARFDSMGFCMEEKYFRLDCSYFMGTSEDNREQLLLYCRAAFLEQFRFLRKQVLEQGALGWIQGSPGTGKTTTTLSFCMTLDMNEWSFKYIRLKAKDNTFVVAVEGNKRKTCSVAKAERKQLTQLLEELSGGKKSLLVLDGYLTHQEYHIKALDACIIWRNADRQNRRLVVVTSMASRGKTYEEEEKHMQLEQHIVPSWRIDEYLDAVQLDEFYDKVKANLEMDVDADILGVKVTNGPKSKEQRVNHKHYLAGASCRYMFDITSEKVLEYLDLAFQRAPNLQDLFRGNVGASAADMTNRLIATFVVQKRVVWYPVSKYVASNLTASVGAVDMLRKMFTTFKGPRAMHGHLLEMLFFEEVRRDLSITYEKSNQPEVLKACNFVVNFDPSQQTDLLPHERVCYKPISEFQGGYDALIVDQIKKVVQFFQMTVAMDHSFKLSYFLSALEALRIPPGRTWTIRIVVVVPPENRWSFRIAPVKDDGALEQYMWTKWLERSMAEVASIDFDRGYIG
ncbi:hypothetical protein GUITHDRAFT_106401 [Guillardia theta CCMP2712]|uniref:Uncharacterized protein n=1 Tax=Guillardia theta (strain CCMP2712) TaxID=905079 RepID=L1JH89_GUITC|nr:hypothetical protein GUITHDRAFT_106401 [Guillardia theta CCMP2712]EKX47851.1 hypothetical protein GUITHDRAFT_106401 [Guillardia theta CCMP2712]|eukprot:XP_005834831.1 hypothetical protein GUITHDRAFT_106401 [Guillardia theta CCMP2712]